MLLLATKVWEQRKLGNLFNERKEKSTKGELLSVTLSNGVTKFSDLNKKDNSNIKSGNYKVVKKNDIPYNSMRMWQGASGVSSYDGIVSPAYTVLVPNSNSNSNFYAVLFKKKSILNLFTRFSQGLTSDTWNLKYPILKDIIVPFTNLEEQKRIFKIFNVINNLLALYAKKSSCLDSCIAYFIRILYDDPQFFKQKNVQNSIIKSFKLDDILIKNNAKNKDLSILNVESISNKKGFISQKEQFDNYQVASKDLSNYYVIHPKDFAYNPSRINVGSIAYKSPNDVKGIVSPLYVSFKCKNNIVLDKYLWHWFKSTNFEHQRVRLSEGGVRDILSFNQLSKMKISIPSFEIQRQTINLLEILIQYKEEVDLKLNNLKLIKNTLLQSMFL